MAEHSSLAPPVIPLQHHQHQWKENGEGAAQWIIISNIKIPSYINVANWLFPVSRCECPCLRTWHQIFSILLPIPHWVNTQSATSQTLPYYLFISNLICHKTTPSTCRMAGGFIQPQKYITQKKKSQCLVFMGRRSQAKRLARRLWLSMWGPVPQRPRRLRLPRVLPSRESHVTLFPPN